MSIDGKFYAETMKYINKTHARTFVGRCAAGNHTPEERKKLRKEFKRRVKRATDLKEVLIGYGIDQFEAVKIAFRHEGINGDDYPKAARGLGLEP